MRVTEVWRFPVKSLQGERVGSAAVADGGLDGDRQAAIFDVVTGFGLTARRHPQMLFASASRQDDGTALITLPDGRVAADDAALSAWLGRPVELRSCRADLSRRYEDVADVEHESSSGWVPFGGSSRAFHDSQDAAVSIVSTATVAGWDARRFRTNLVLAGEGEDALVGAQVAVGDVRLDVGVRIERCVMVTRPQPGGVERNRDVLRTIHRERQGALAVGATVARAGTLSVGDLLTVCRRSDMASGADS